MATMTITDAQTSSGLPLRSAADLESLAGFLQTLARLTPSRLTVRQSLIFIVIAYHHAMNREITVRGIQEILGDGEISKSIDRTYQVFLAPSHQYPEGLGWVDQHEDPTDRRRKALKLSVPGIEATRDLLEAIRAA